jgi:hypothetical protein
MAGRPRVELETFKDNLARWFEEGSTFDELAVQLYNIHHVQVTARTIQNRFRQWGYPSMYELKTLLSFELELSTFS